MYYKVIIANINFTEAINEFNKNNIIRYKNYQIYNPLEIKNLNNEKFSIEQIQSNEWNVIVPDNEMNNKLEEIKDIMHEMNLNIDSRFYNEDKMDIYDYWNLFEQQFIKDNLAYHIMKWFYYNKYNKKTK